MMKSRVTAGSAREPDISLEVCGYRHLLDLISSKWVVLVLHAMEDGRIRYREMQRRIADISQKMLTQTLRQLERDGLIERHIHPAVPPVVEYNLSPIGEALMQEMRRFKHWMKAYYPLVEQARQAYDHNHSRTEQE